MFDAGKTRMKNFEDMLNHFYLIPERNRQMDGWTDRQICYINIARQYADTL